MYLIIYLKLQFDNFIIYIPIGYETTIRLDDTTGWHGLESSFNALHALLDGCRSIHIKILIDKFRDPSLVDLIIVKGSNHMNRYIREATHKFSKLLVDKFIDIELNNKFKKKNPIQHIDVKTKIISNIDKELNNEIDKELDKEVKIDELYLINNPDVMLLMDKISNSLCNGLQDNWYEFYIHLIFI